MDDEGDQIRPNSPLGNPDNVDHVDGEGDQIKFISQLGDPDDVAH